MRSGPDACVDQGPVHRETDARQVHHGPDVRQVGRNTLRVADLEHPALQPEPVGCSSQCRLPGTENDRQGLVQGTLQEQVAGIAEHAVDEDPGLHEASPLWAARRMASERPVCSERPGCHGGARPITPWARWGGRDHAEPDPGCGEPDPGCGVLAGSTSNMAAAGLSNARRQGAASPRLRTACAARACRSCGRNHPRPPSRSRRARATSRCSTARDRAPAVRHRTRSRG